ncbi:M16 family metallopeptidase [Elongatibacter sediminis]|uniref:Pitrilysin family protein n=1 Tax=Elongatibacter sediminis TaxID=3119006 RepID=A0AAW9RGN3_9GAMM
MHNPQTNPILRRSRGFLKLAAAAIASLLIASCAPEEPVGGDASDDSAAAAGSAAAAPDSDLPPGVTLIEEYAGAIDGVSIPYAKYRLDNGLTVILHEDHSDPLAHVDLSFHVGSSREEPGRSGFAHFFEHMMFEGSKHVDEGEHGRIITNAGGSLNGTTNSDRTNYYESIPVNQLEIALWLEADRMGFLLEAVDQEKFEVQRETVKNERGQRVDNVPYGRASETMMKNLYAPEHPYSWPVIGWTEDLDAATLNDLERFFLRWYGPNNAQLTIGGAIDSAQTLEWVAKYFGPIPAGPEVPRLTPQPGELEADRYVTLEDNIHLPAVAMLFPTVYYNHADEAPLDAAAKILGQGKASLLYQRLVQSGRAVSAFVSHACRELACEMAFIVVQNPSSGETLAEMEQEIRAVLAEFTERGVSDEDLQKFKAQYEAGRIFGLQSVSGKVGALAYSEMFHGDPKALQNDFERYAAVEPDQVVRAFNQYVTGRPAVVLSIVPNGKPEMAAREPNYSAPQRLTASADSPPDVSPEAPQPQPELREVEDSFDRSVQPEPGINPVVLLPPITDTRLGNGVRLLVVENEETPTVAIQAVFDVGQRDEPQGKAGLAALTATLMNEATTERSAAEFTEALERIGARLSVSAGQYETTVSLSVLAKHLDEGMDLMMERLLQPAFTDEDFQRIKSRTLEGLIQARKSGPSLAARATSAVLAGPTHPLSYPGSGLPSTVEAITPEDVRDFYAEHIPTRLKGVLASTSVPIESLTGRLAPLGELAVKAAAREPMDGLLQPNGQQIYFVDKADAAQSSVRVFHPSLPYDALGEYYLAALMNFNLGGTFDSRINLNLREEKGWTYGARSSFSGGPEFGAFRVSAEINREATADAIREILNELERYASEGMSEDEYRFLQSAIGQRDALRYETPGEKLGLLGQILSYDLPLDYRARQQDLLRETGRGQLNELAGRLIDVQNLAIVVVGDAATVLPQLESLERPIRVLDADGFATDPVPAP